MIHLPPKSWHTALPSLKITTTKQQFKYPSINLEMEHSASVQHIASRLNLLVLCSAAGRTVNTSNHMHWLHSVELASFARYDANQLALSDSPSDWRPTSTRSIRGRSHGTPSPSAERSVSFSSWSWGPVWPWDWKWPPSCREKPSQGALGSYVPLTDG